MAILSIAALSINDMVLRVHTAFLLEVGLLNHRMCVASVFKENAKLQSGGISIQSGGISPSSIVVQFVGM